MARDDVHVAFARAAAEDGIVLARQSFPWLCEQGHIGLARVASEQPGATREPALRAALQTLGTIYARLKGDVSVLLASRANLLLALELVHAPSATLIEVDTDVHFTSFRLAALECYPPDFIAGFDLDEHKELCRSRCTETDGLGRGLAARGFGFGGVPRERAYRDALKDLATPAMGHPALVRIAALDGDGAAAYRAGRERLRALLGA